MIGWRRWGAALAAGGAASLAMPPLGAWPVLAPCFMVLLWLLDGVATEGAAKSGRRAFLIGWCFGFGFFVLSLYWISVALTVDLERFWWLLPVSAFGPPAALALYCGGATWATWRLTRSWSAGREEGLEGAASGRLLRRRLARVFVFAVVWACSEWLRGHLFTGFPWNLTGHAWVGSVQALQLVSATGVYGAGLIVVCLAGAASLLGDAGLPRRSVRATIGVGGVVLAAIFGFGALRLASAPVLPSSGDLGSWSGMVYGVRLRLVQPNILQSDKWNPVQRDIIFSRHLELAAGYLAPGDQAARGPSLPPTLVAATDGRSSTGTSLIGTSSAQNSSAENGPAEPVFGSSVGNGGGYSDRPRKLIIWPETSVPSFLDADAARRMAIASVTPAGGLHMVGAPRMSFDPDRKRRFWNSLVMIDGSGAVVGTYDKFHLVPFGEYVPLRRWLPSWLPVSSIAAGFADFSSGPGPRTLRIPGLPAVSPLICYEGIFPGEATDPADRPEWLLSVTNDAWYGRTAGPHQHFAMTQTRAVEEGLPLVRVANTGISGVVDGYGRIVASLGLGLGGVVDSPLPAALPPTLYARFGDLVFAGMLALAAAAAAALRRWDAAS